MSHGTADQMLAAFEQRIAILENQPDSVDSATSLKAGSGKMLKQLYASASITYIPELTDAVNDELEDLDIFDSWNWNRDQKALVLTTVSGSDVHEYTIPYKDLNLDSSKIDEDVEYIMQAVTAQDDQSDVASATTVQGSSEVSVNTGDEAIKYKDTDGIIGGDPSAIYSLADLKILWNSEKDSDPSMSCYSSFDEWFADTQNWIQEIDSCTSVNCSDDSDVSNYVLLDSKRVPDADGFMTDYSLYSNTSGDGAQYVCILGDRDLYSPDNDDPDFVPDFDFESDDEDEAREWFDDYTGCNEDDDYYDDSEIE